MTKKIMIEQDDFTQRLNETINSDEKLQGFRQVYQMVLEVMPPDLMKDPVASFLVGMSALDAMMSFAPITKH
jgi:hypothetical protein